MKHYRNTPRRTDDNALLLAEGLRIPLRVKRLIAHRGRRSTAL